MLHYHHVIRYVGYCQHVVIQLNDRCHVGGFANVHYHHGGNLQFGHDVSH